MEFEVEFYKTASGYSPVRQFLLELKASDPGDFAAVAAGLDKLRHRQYHRERCPRHWAMACLNSATWAS